MNTFSFFSIGYILFWILPFFVIARIFIKTKRLENILKNLENDKPTNGN